MKNYNIALWFLLFSFQLFAQDPNWKVYTPANSGLPDLPLSSIAIENNDIKWIMTTNSLIKFDWINWEVFDSSNSLMPGGWWDGVITRGGDGNTWIGGFGGWGEYNIGLVNVSSTPWTVYDTLNSSLAYISISSLSPSRDDGVWMVSWPGTLGGWGTLQKLTNDVWYSSQAQPRYHSEEIEEDLHGSVWYTVDNLFGIVHRITGDSTISYNILSGAAQSIETDFFGNVWMSWYAQPIQPSGLVKYDGDEWTVFTTENSNLPTEHVWNLVADSVGNLWMSGEGLIKFDGMNFTHYTPANSGLYSTAIRDIQIDEFNNKWIIHPNAISVFNEEGVTSVGVGDELHNNFTLSQNYPNPFNPTTTIKFKIPQSPLPGGDGRGGLVTLKVYDVLGNEIATLVNAEKPAGSYEVEFNSHSGSVRNLPSGIYFYRLTVGRFADTKKLILLK
jgi:hypothetical protein